MLYTNRRYEEAIKEAEKAIALDGKDAIGYIAHANALTASGRADEAIRRIQKAMYLKPDYPVSFQYALGLAEFSRKNYKQAAVALELVARHNSLDYRPYLFLIASYGHLGYRQQATTTITNANLVRKQLQLPNITATTPLDPWEEWPYRDQAELAQLQSGLRAAGLPEW